MSEISMVQYQAALRWRGYGQEARIGNGYGNIHRVPPLPSARRDVGVAVTLAHTGLVTVALAELATELR